MIFLFFLTCAVVFVVLGLRERARYAREVTQVPGPSFEQMIGRTRRGGQTWTVQVLPKTDLIGGRELDYMGAVLNVRRRWLESDRSLRARCLKALRVCDTGNR